MTITVSVRLSEDHLAYLYEALSTQGYTPTTMSDLVRLSSAQYLQQSKPGFINKAPEQSTIDLLRSWRAPNKGFVKLKDILEPVTVAATPPSVDKYPPDLWLSLPSKDHTNGQRILSSLNAGLSLSDQLNSTNAIVARITLALAALIPPSSLTEEEQTLITTLKEKE